MKKTLAGIVLAIALCMGMTTTALAAEASASAARTETFEWSYVNGTGGTPATYPADTLTFAVEAASTNPDIDPKPTIDRLTVSANPGSITVNVPSYDTIGEYAYTVTPTSDASSGYPIVGVTYEPLQVKVLVTYSDDTRTAMTSTVYLASSDGAKISGVSNVYGLGTLTVQPKVTGNYGTSDETFAIRVQMDVSRPNTVKSEITYVVGGETKTLSVSGWAGQSYRAVEASLKDGEQIVFTNIPAGVKYSVTESGNGSGGSFSYSDESRTIADGDSDVATVTYVRNAEIPTGVFLDNMPIVMAAAVAVAGVVALLALKRRRANR